MSPRTPGLLSISTVNGQSLGHESFAELKSCVKVEVTVLGSPALIVIKVSVDVNQH